MSIEPGQVLGVAVLIETAILWGLLRRGDRQLRELKRRLRESDD